MPEETRPDAHRLHRREFHLVEPNSNICHVFFLFLWLKMFLPFLSILSSLSHDDHAYDERLISTIFTTVLRSFSRYCILSSSEMEGPFTFCMIDIPGDSSRRCVWSIVFFILLVYLAFLLFRSFSMFQHCPRIYLTYIPNCRYDQGEYLHALE